MPIKRSDLTETNRAMVQQPNIVLFMTDQLRRDALGCYGNRINPPFPALRSGPTAVSGASLQKQIPGSNIWIEEIKDE
jgi:hypothetical protein